MTFDEFYENHKGTGDKDELQHVWSQAQHNYPYCVSDERLKEAIVEALVDNYDYKEKQAELFAEKYGPDIVDDMWNEFDNSIEYCVDKDN